MYVCTYIRCVWLADKVSRSCLSYPSTYVRMCACRYVYTVWLEILAGRYFGGLLKICHLAEFTLAVEPVLAIMIFIAKWLIERAGNLTLL